MVNKKVNRRLLGVVLGGTALGLGAAASMTPKGKSFWKRVKEFFSRGWDELKKGM